MIDDHFAGRIREHSERRLREHLPGCDSCREYYRRHQILAGLDPKSLTAKARLAGGLGLTMEPAASRSPVWPLAVASAAAAAAFLVTWLVFMPTGQDHPSTGFVARGKQEQVTPASLLVFRLIQGAQPEPASERIRAGDELAFAYRNQAGKKTLLVFGVDEHQNIYWYHPAWQRPEENPVSVPIHSGDGVFELPEAVQHTLRGDSLKIYAVFDDRSWTVKEAEALVQRSPDRPDRLPFGDAILQTIQLEVEHRQ
jgi:hypothetical protein